jgi:hypothetical protein
MFLFQQYYYNMKQKYQQILILFNTKTKGIFNSACSQGVIAGTFLYKKALHLLIFFCYAHFHLKIYRGFIFIVG